MFNSYWLKHFNREDIKTGYNFQRDKMNELI